MPREGRTVRWVALDPEEIFDGWEAPKPYIRIVPQPADRSAEPVGVGAR